MLDGMLILWAILTVLSFIYVVYDLIANTPEAGVMKVGWALVVLYTGPIGLFFYFLTCREPMPGTHEKFIDKLWKQATGSEVHCLAGDATGIIIAAMVLSAYEIPRFWEVCLEYAAGFISGLLIFQALFMRKMMGGTYMKALKTSFYPEWLVDKGLKHGMMTVRKDEPPQEHEEKHEHHNMEPKVGQKSVYKALIVSLVGLAIGIVIAVVGAYV